MYGTISLDLESEGQSSHLMADSSLIIVFTAAISLSRSCLTLSICGSAHALNAAPDSPLEPPPPSLGTDEGMMEAFLRGGDLL